MKRNRNNFGFSLIEVLIATGIMAIGLVMVSLVFPVGLKLTTLTTERTIGAVVADEAFAKVQLYGLRGFQYWPVVDPNHSCSDYFYTTNYTGTDLVWNNGNEFALENDFQYPSSTTLTQQDRNYHWSALCRRVDAKDVQVTVFVSRKIAAGSEFRAWDPIATDITTSDWPKPVQVNVIYDPASPRQLAVTAGPGSLAEVTSQNFFDGGFTIVDNYSGKIYRVLEVKDVDGNGIQDIILMENWQPTLYSPNDTVWVVPPAVGSDRYPCVGVFQKVIRFDDIN